MGGFEQESYLHHRNLFSIDSTSFALSHDSNHRSIYLVYSM